MVLMHLFAKQSRHTDVWTSRGGGGGRAWESGADHVHDDLGERGRLCT